MQSATASDITFVGSKTQAVLLGRAASSGVSTAEGVPTGIVAKASGEFAAIAAEREASEGLSASERFAKTRALLAKSKAASRNLGEQAFGAPVADQDKSVDEKGKIADAVAKVAANMGGLITRADDKIPGRQFTPAPIQDKSTQIS